MATLSLNRLWLNLFDDGTAIAAYSADRSEQYSDIGDVAHLAGGRQRSIRVVGEQGTFAFTLVDVPVSDVDTLRLWKGEAVQARTDRGVRVVGAFFQVTPSEVRDRVGYYNVAISMRSLTVVEGV